MLPAQNWITLQGLNFFERPFDFASSKSTYPILLFTCSGNNSQRRSVTELRKRVMTVWILAHLCNFPCSSSKCFFKETHCVTKDTKRRRVHASVWLVAMWSCPVCLVGPSCRVDVPPIDQVIGADTLVSARAMPPHFLNAVLMSILYNTSLSWPNAQKFSSVLRSFDGRAALKVKLCLVLNMTLKIWFCPVPEVLKSS